jgi:hypothetical protein
MNEEEWCDLANRHIADLFTFVSAYAPHEVDDFPIYIYQADMSNVHRAIFEAYVHVMDKTWVQGIPSWDCINRLISDFPL